MACGRTSRAPACRSPQVHRRAPPTEKQVGTNAIGTGACRAPARPGAFSLRGALRPITPRVDLHRRADPRSAHRGPAGRHRRQRTGVVDPSGDARAGQLRRTADRSAAAGAASQPTRPAAQCRGPDRQQGRTARRRGRSTRLGGRREPGARRRPDRGVASARRRPHRGRLPRPVRCGSASRRLADPGRPSRGTARHRRLGHRRSRRQRLPSTSSPEPQAGRSGKSPRHLQIIGLLAEHREGLTASELSTALFGSPDRTVSARAEMSRLRRHLRELLSSSPYRFNDAVQVRFPAR